MIDAHAARHDPEEFRRRLARKGAGETFDAWLAADERWRELVPRVDELRSRTKVKGKPTPEQLEELRNGRAVSQFAEGGADLLIGFDVIRNPEPGEPQEERGCGSEVEQQGVTERGSGCCGHRKVG